MGNKYENLTGPFKVFDKIIDDFNKDPMVKLASDMVSVGKKSSDLHIKKLKREIEELKIANKIQKVTIEELKRENKLHKKQLARFGKIFDRYDRSNEVNQEIDAARGQEVEFNNSHEEKL